MIMDKYQIIDKTLKLLSEYNISDNNSLKRDLLMRFEKGMTGNTENTEKKECYKNCWGGEVWDQLYHYYNEEYKRILVINYDEKEESSRCISPILSEFPYDRLNEICIEFIE